MAKSGVTVFSAVTSTITILLCLSLLPTSYATVVPSSNLRSFYTRAHSLGDEYEFTALEGWYTINATDLGYKYNDSGKPSGHQSRKTSAKVVLSSDANVLSNTLSHIGGTIVHLLNEVWNDLKGFGKSEQVKITWYTGHDLLNPSCWANTKWAPTVSLVNFSEFTTHHLTVNQDESFTCALTLKGWNDRPQCLKFLECRYYDTLFEYLLIHINSMQRTEKVYFCSGS